MYTLDFKLLFSFLIVSTLFLQVKGADVPAPFQPFPASFMAVHDTDSERVSQQEIDDCYARYKRSFSHEQFKDRITKDEWENYWNNPEDLVRRYCEQGGQKKFWARPVPYWALSDYRRE